MTPPDHRLPPDDGPDDLDADELAVHAVLDGEADADQRRRVARDPVLVARVAALRTVAEEVGLPVTPPPDDVLARIRATAIDAATGEDVDAATHPPSAVSTSDDATDDARAAAAHGAPSDGHRTAPGDEVAARRARRRRAGLPPLGAVAAVVLLLVLFGAGLILTDRSGDADQAATRSESGGDSADAAAEGAGDDGGVTPAEEQEALRGEATASFPDDAALQVALQQVDPETLDLAALGDPPAAADAASPSTTVPAESTESADDAPLSGDVPEESTTATSGATTNISVDDPRVQRCDTVLMSAEDGIEPATAAAIVLVDDTPVLVLSNPVTATADREAGIRLSTFDPISCVPGNGVLHDPPG